MPEVDVLNIENKPIGKVKLPEEIFGASVNKGMLHEAIRNYLANQRHGTHATKTRGMVRGGGRKPWRQKKTGRARHGSIRSPLWRGGGVVFGPQPRDYSYAIPKKVKWMALSSALSAKLSDGEFIVIEDLSLKEGKTKEMVSILNTLGLKDNSVLIIIPDKDKTLELAVRNIPNVNIGRITNGLNAYDILACQRLLMTRKAVEYMREVYL